MKKLLSILILIQIFACSTTVKKNDSIVIFDDSILNIIDTSAEIEYLIDSLNVAEGPLWDENSSSLLLLRYQQIKFISGMKMMDMKFTYLPLDILIMLL